MGVTTLVLRIGLVIFVIEALIMVGFSLLPFELDSGREALFDAVLLTLLSSPPLFFWVIKPYVEAQKAVERAAETARHKSERHLAQVLGAVVDGIVTSDDRGVVQIFNPAAEDIFGYKAEEIIGQSINLLMPSSEANHHDRYLHSYEKTGRATVIGYGREVQGKRKDGSLFPIDLAISELELDGQRFYTGVVRDITDRKKAEQALIDARDQAERASRVKSEFMANMSHELRTPLNAIIGFSEVARSELFGPLGHEKYNEYVGDIQDSAQHLLELINDILDMARIEADKLEIHEEPVDVAETAISPIHFVTTAKLDIENRIPNDLPYLCVDARRLKQIMLNVLSNAVKFTPEGGNVVIDAYVGETGGIVLRVEDTGIGMDEDEIERALKPFEQLDTGLNRRYEGTGLGLPLVERMAALNGGMLRIESEKGRGTTVYIEFVPDRTVARDAVAVQEG